MILGGSASGYKAMKRPFGRGPTTPVQGLTITMVILVTYYLGARPPSTPDLEN